MGLYDVFKKQCKTGFNLEGASLQDALAFLDGKTEELQQLNGTTVLSASEEYDKYIKTLVALERKEKNAWWFVIDLPRGTDKYIGVPNVQFCGGSPSFARCVITFTQNLDMNFIPLSAVSKPELTSITSLTGTPLSFLREFYDGAGIQRFAILGAARRNPEKDAWVAKLNAHIQGQVDGFLRYMEGLKTPFTTLNGGWAGVVENSMGLPMISYLMGATTTWADVLPPVTVMPSGGSYDRVKTIEEQTEVYKGEKYHRQPSYFQVEGVWGDDSPFLVGLSTGLLVFSPYGLWTQIEIANGIAQGKPVAVILNPGSKDDKADQDLIAEIDNNVKDQKPPYIEKQWTLPNDSSKPYRLYKDASEAAKWFNKK